MSELISDMLYSSIVTGKVPEIRIPPNPLIVAANANQASEFYKRIMEMITDFDATLDEAHDVGVRLVTFGQTVVFHLDDIGYYDPSLISFYGTTDEGGPVQLIQHVSQISLLLMKLPRKNPLEPKRPIGFESTAKSTAKSSPNIPE